MSLTGNKPVPTRRSGWRFFVRAVRLRCRECGISPIFVPLRRTRTLDDWLTPLDGCPRCGYAYNREEGYFLMAIWGVHYFAVAGFGLVLGLILEQFLTIDIGWVVLLTALPTILVGSSSRVMRSRFTSPSTITAIRM